MTNWISHVEWNEKIRIFFFISITIVTGKAGFVYILQWSENFNEKSFLFACQDELKPLKMQLQGIYTTLD